MIDREKVIKGVECHRKKVQTANAVSCLECPYSEPNPIREWCMSGLMDDIYVLLKEQEAVEPDTDSEGTCSCGNCGENVGWYPIGSKTPVKCGNFCPECGRKVKWE